jgi:transcriptional regulator GlxA family with amidase domain
VEGPTTPEPRVPTLGLRIKVSEIASACGFNEIPYFNRCFRRHFDASPTGFRGTDGAPK